MSNTLNLQENRLLNPIRMLGLSLFFEMQIWLLPFSLFFYQQNGLSTETFFLFQSIFFFASLLLEIPTGYISDLIPRKWIIVIAYLFNIIRLLLFLFFYGYVPVLLGEICYACCKSFLSGSIDSYVYDFLKDKKVHHKMLAKYGKVSSMMSLGTAVASLLSVFVYKQGLYALVIVEYIVASFGLLIVLFLPNIAVYKRKNLEVTEIFKTVNFIRYKKNLCILLCFTAICFATTNIFATSFQPILKEASVPVAFFSILYFFNHMTRAITSHFSQKIKKTLGLKGLIILTIFLLSCSFIGFLLTGYYVSSAFAIMVVALACISISFHLVIQIVTVSYLHTVVPNALRSTCSSFLSLILKGSSAISLFFFKDFVKVQENTSSVYAVYGILFSATLFFLYRKLSLKKLSRISSP